jgi:uncharacterized protein YbjT (DUF2867 family)
MKRILVIGATGTIGRQVVAQLLARGTNVRALSRRPGAGDFPDGVEAMRGDLTDPATLEGPLDGADAVFLVWTAQSHTVDAVVERIAGSTRRLVLLTSPHTTPHPLFQQPNPMAAMFAGIERAIEAAGLAWTFLRPGMFAANALGWWGGQIRSGDIVRWPYGETPTAPIHEGDIAAVAVRTLLEENHERKEYVLTGPDFLTQREQVGIIGNAIGRPLRFEELSPEEARRELPFPPLATDMLLAAWSAARGHRAFVNPTVEKITGNPPRTFREWATEHAAAFR